MVAEKIPVNVACRVLAVSESGYYERLKRAPSERAVRHAWLTDLITQVHIEARGTYGAGRVHAELTLGCGIVVGHGQVVLLMQRAGLCGVTGRPKWKRNKPDSIASDKVNRVFGRTGPNQLWVRMRQNPRSAETLIGRPSHHGASGRRSRAWVG